ncbi:protein of unknown function [Candidatus Nitrotoga arctica]|uniref:Uncharacterized protein n=1 Tax=Candidatus Nitrotoga arctica TaxID=453162 RepID=A0ABM8YX28_9PROT|nr:protein of unknown function [Candidatus Nitrotoga arctica]
MCGLNAVIMEDLEETLGDNIYRIDFSFSVKALPKFIDAVKKGHAVRCSFFDHTLSVSVRILPDEIMTENHQSDFITTATLK